MTCSDSRIHVYSLDLSLSLHEDKFPLPGESSLQPGKVLLEEPIRCNIRGDGLFEFKVFRWLHYPFTVMACHKFGLTLLSKVPKCCYHTEFRFLGTVFVLLNQWVQQLYLIIIKVIIWHLGCYLLWKDWRHFRFTLPQTAGLLSFKSENREKSSLARSKGDKTDLRL